MFDRKIVPIHICSSEIWGFNVRKSVEKVHILHTSKGAPNPVTYGYSGRLPLFLKYYVSFIKFRVRIISMCNDRYIYESYNVTKYIGLDAVRIGPLMLEEIFFTNMALVIARSRKL